MSHHTSGLDGHRERSYTLSLIDCLSSSGSYDSALTIVCCKQRENCFQNQ